MPTAHFVASPEDTGTRAGRPWNLELHVAAGGGEKRETDVVRLDLRPTGGITFEEWHLIAGETEFDEQGLLLGMNTIAEVIGRQNADATAGACNKLLRSTPAQTRTACGALHARKARLALSGVSPCEQSLEGRRTDEVVSRSGAFDAGSVALRFSSELESLEDEYQRLKAEHFLNET